MGGNIQQSLENHLLCSLIMHYLFASTNIKCAIVNEAGVLALQDLSFAMNLPAVYYNSTTHVVITVNAQRKRKE